MRYHIKQKQDPFIAHKWFAWRPVKVGQITWVWLETIWRVRRIESPRVPGVVPSSWEYWEYAFEESPLLQGKVYVR